MPPVRIEQIPSLSLSDGYQLPRADARAAAAPAAALGQVAESISQLGGVFVEHARKVQEMDDQTVLSQTRSGWVRGAADLQLQNEKEQDPAKRLRNYDDFLSKTRSQIDNPALSPRVRRELTQAYGGFSDELYIRSRAEAARLTARNLDLATQREIDDATTPEELRKAYQSRVAGGLASKDSLEKAEQGFLEKQKDNEDLRMQLEHPDVWLANNKRDRIPKGADPIKYQNGIDRAERALSAKTASQTRDALDAMHGDNPTITTEAQLDAFTAGMRPEAREPLRENLRALSSEKERQRRATPEYLAQTIGAVQLKLDGYKSSGENFDRDFTEILTLVHSLPPGDYRDQLEAHANSVREGQLVQIRSNADQGRKQLLDLAHNGKFGNLTASGKIGAPLQRLINDGMLRNPETLRQAGFTPLQADAIVSLDEGKLIDQLAWAGVTEQEAKRLASSRSEADRIQVFRYLHSRRSGTDDDLTPLQRETFKAIVDGKEPSTMVEVIDPEREDQAITERQKAEENFGRARIELDNFLRANPNASEKDISAKVFSLAAENTRRQAAATRIPDALPRPGAADTTPQERPVGSTLDEVLGNLEAQESTYGPRRSETDSTTTRTERIATHRARVERAAKDADMTFTPHELDALTSFDLSTGSISTLLDRGRPDKKEIAAKMLHYRNTGGQRNPGLERRRRIEANLFTNGYSK